MKFIYMMFLLAAPVCGALMAVNCIIAHLFSECNGNETSQYNEVCDDLDDFYDISCIHKDKLTAFYATTLPVETLLNTKHLMYHLCNKVSYQFQYQSDISMVMDCFGDRWDDLKNCRDESEAVFYIYASIVHNLKVYRNDEENDYFYELQNFHICMKMKYMLDCLRDKISLSCGDSATSIFDNFLLESQYLSIYCEPYEFEDAKRVLEVVHIFIKELGSQSNNTDIF